MPFDPRVDTRINLEPQYDLSIYSGFFLETVTKVFGFKDGTYGVIRAFGNKVLVSLFNADETPFLEDREISNLNINCPGDTRTVAMDAAVLPASNDLPFEKIVVVHSIWECNKFEMVIVDQRGNHVFNQAIDHLNDETTLFHELTLAASNLTSFNYFMFSYITFPRYVGHTINVVAIRENGIVIFRDSIIVDSISSNRSPSPPAFMAIAINNQANSLLVFILPELNFPKIYATQYDNLGNVLLTPTIIWGFSHFTNFTNIFLRAISHDADYFIGHTQTILNTGAPYPPTFLDVNHLDRNVVSKGIVSLSRPLNYLSLVRLADLTFINNNFLAVLFTAVDFNLKRDVLVDFVELSENANFVRISRPFLINTFLVGDQDADKIAALPNSNFVFSFMDRQRNALVLGTSINKPPRIEFSRNVTYTEGGSAIVVFPNVLLYDDDTLLSRVHIILQDQFGLGQLLTPLSPCSGLSILIPGYNRITIAGFASLTDYQDCIQKIYYQNFEVNFLRSSDFFATISINVLDYHESSIIQDQLVLIERINDQPFVNVPITNFTWIEDADPIFVLEGVTITDPENDFLIRAEITLIPALPGDCLQMTPNFGFADQDPEKGRLVIARQDGGVDSTERFAMLLSSVRYYNELNEPINFEPRQLHVVVFDAGYPQGVSSQPRDIFINLQSVNDLPVISFDPSITWEENRGPVQVFENLHIADNEDSLLCYVRVVFNENFYFLGDILQANIQNEILSIPSLPSLILVGPDWQPMPIADFEMAISSIRFNSIAHEFNNNMASTRQINIALFQYNSIPCQQVFSESVNNAISQQTVTINVILRNDAPVINVLSMVTWSEDSPPTHVFQELTITDEENNDIESARIIIEPYRDGDTFEMPPTLGIIGIQNGNEFTLDHLDEATMRISDLQQALSNVRYVNDQLESQSTQIRQITLELTDNGIPPATVTRRVTLEILPTNDAPRLTSSTPLIMSYQENQRMMPFAAWRITNPELNQRLRRLTIQQLNYVADQDQLTCYAQGGVEVTSHAETGEINFTHFATLEIYQSILTTCEWQILSHAPNTTARVLAVSCEDEGGASSDVLHQQLNVMPINDPPTISRNQLTIGQGEQLALTASNLLAEDPDSNARELLYRVMRASANIKFHQCEDLEAIPLNEFTQQQVNEGAICAVHDESSEEAPTFTMSVIDQAQPEALLASEESIANINFINRNDPPYVDQAFTDEQCTMNSVCRFTKNLGFFKDPDPQERLRFTARDDRQLLSRSTAAERWAFDPELGIFNGTTPSEPGIYPFTVTAYDKQNFTAHNSFNVVVGGVASGTGLNPLQTLGIVAATLAVVCTFSSGAIGLFFKYRQYRKNQFVENEQLIIFTKLLSTYKLDPYKIKSKLLSNSLGSLFKMDDADRENKLSKTEMLFANRLLGAWRDYIDYRVNQQGNVDAEHVAILLNFLPKKLLDNTMKTNHVIKLAIAIAESLLDYGSQNSFDILLDEVMDINNANADASDISDGSMHAIMKKVFDKIIRNEFNDSEVLITSLTQKYHKLRDNIAGLVSIFKETYQEVAPQIRNLTENFNLNVPDSAQSDGYLRSLFNQLRPH
ncbi:MAG: hypothetical protein Tsb005_17760 [Gammaproteobacteria bacterium]